MHDFVLLYYLHFVFYCTHVRMSYVLNSYLLKFQRYSNYLCLHILPIININTESRTDHAGQWGQWCGRTSPSAGSRSWRRSARFVSRRREAGMSGRRDRRGRPTAYTWHPRDRTPAVGRTAQCTPTQTRCLHMPPWTPTSVSSWCHVSSPVCSSLTRHGP